MGFITKEAQIIVIEKSKMDDEIFDEIKNITGIGLEEKGKSFKISIS